ncbi:DUF2795 domain-containing protein [Phytoactinopolyspora halotolerans]|uniref:DUF2795 domain-containing protein n=1 Tax=Phytoactinopolyspora halotolerans TaxID=1981512 RepID=A0A6L9S9C3_9ACTN|nr:DUF2795 domain-containing protein [Phytoactinopolyspora halotolerans]NEE01689.1 DUF2795 domain-containing protein [Phytoactinopolyspora halotolerans]
MDVTRLEIADAIEDAFNAPPASKADLLAQATAKRARVELLDTLNRLPERDYRNLRDLWPHLAGVPVGD